MLKKISITITVILLVGRTKSELGVGCDHGQPLVVLYGAQCSKCFTALV